MTGELQAPSRSLGAMIKEERIAVVMNEVENVGMEVKVFHIWRLMYATMHCLGMHA